MKKFKRVVCILLTLLLTDGTFSETAMNEKQGLFKISTVQAAAQNLSSYTGWKTVSGKRRYYQNGRMKKGFSRIGNDYYCFDTKGNMHTGWQYTGKRYRYFDKKTGKMLVCVNPKWYRPTDVVNLWGDPTKAKTKLGWNPQKTSYEQLCAIMAEHDLQLAKKEAGIQ